MVQAYRFKINENKIKSKIVVLLTPYAKVFPKMDDVSET